MKFLENLSAIMIYTSPLIFIAGLIFTAIKKENRKIGLYLIIGSIIVFIIGVTICLSILDTSHGF